MGLVFSLVPDDVGAACFVGVAQSNDKEKLISPTIKR